MIAAGLFCTEQHGHDVYYSFSMFVESAFAGSLDHFVWVHEYARLTWSTYPTPLCGSVIDARAEHSKSAVVVRRGLFTSHDAAEPKHMSAFLSSVHTIDDSPLKSPGLSSLPRPSRGLPSQRPRQPR